MRRFGALLLSAWLAVAPTVALAQAAVPQPAPSSSSASGQASLIPAWTSGNWYTPAFFTVAAGVAVLANSIRCILQIMPATGTFKALGARITTVGTTNIQLAVYPYVGGSPYANSGDIVDTGTGVITSGALTAFTIPAGPYWACENANDSTVVLSTISAGSGQMAWARGSATEANIVESAGTSRVFLTFAQTYGTWPSLTIASMTESTGSSNAAIFLQAN